MGTNEAHCAFGAVVGSEELEVHGLVAAIDLNKAADDAVFCKNGFRLKREAVEVRFQHLALERSRLRSRKALCHNLSGRDHADNGDHKCFHFLSP